MPLNIAVDEIFAEIFFDPHEKNICISHAVKEGKLVARERDSG